MVEQSIASHMDSIEESLCERFCSSKLMTLHIVFVGGLLGNILQYVISRHIALKIYWTKWALVVQLSIIFFFSLSLSYRSNATNGESFSVGLLKVFQQAIIWHQIVQTKNGIIFSFVGWKQVGNVHEVHAHNTYDTYIWALVQSLKFGFRIEWSIYFILFLWDQMANKANATCIKNQENAAATREAGPLGRETPPHTK